MSYPQLTDTARGLHLLPTGRTVTAESFAGRELCVSAQ